jgi:hypothetical protein
MCMHLIIRFGMLVSNLEDQWKPMDFFILFLNGNGIGKGPNTNRILAH